jgi:hypothetical protein
VLEDRRSHTRRAADHGEPGDAGTDWIRVDSNGTRRQDQRMQFLADGGTLILMRYDAALIRGNEEFTRALASGRETTYASQYMYMTPQFGVSHDTYDWLTQSLFIGRGRLAALSESSTRSTGSASEYAAVLRLPRRASSSPHTAPRDRGGQRGP